MNSAINLLNAKPGAMFYTYSLLSCILHLKQKGVNGLLLCVAKKQNKKSVGYGHKKKQGADSKVMGEGGCGGMVKRCKKSSIKISSKILLSCHCFYTVLN